tara:strand:+ start:1186 stop:2133 length:948 start_codon:yes stop_codon:yes gene_type:complete
MIHLLNKIYFIIWSNLLYPITVVPNRPWFLFKSIRKFFKIIEPNEWPNSIINRSQLRWGLRYSKDHISRAFLYNNGIYEPHSYSLVKKYLKKGMTFLDVGANCGYYTILAGSIVGSDGKVISFEPSSNYFNELQKNVKNNYLENVQCINKGLSDKKEILELISDGSNASFVEGWMKEVIFSSDKVSDSYKKHKTLNSEKAHLNTLDDEINRLGIKAVDFIKIDIEGYENNFYKGAINTIKEHRPLILLEYTAGVSNKLILPSLNKLNYNFIPENFNFNIINYHSLLQAKWNEKPAGHILDGRYFYNILCVPEKYS